MELKNLDAFVEIAKSKTKKRIVVAAAEDQPVLEAVVNAEKAGIVDATLVGDVEKIKAIAKEINVDISNCELVDEKDPAKASKVAVEIIRSGKGDIMMKGLVGTAPFLRAILDKDNGLRSGALLSHHAFFELPGYHKLLALTDAAQNLAPTFEDKVAILNNSLSVYKNLGFDNPKVAILAAVETVNPKMEATVHAAMLEMMNKRKQIKGAIIEGPLALDNAVSKEAAHHKGIESQVAGEVDLLVAPDIEAANMIYKSLTYLAGATTAAVIVGAKAPIVLTSRADSDRSKFCSIALAAAIS